MVESHKRSVAKAISWRIAATLTTVIIVYIFTHKLVLAMEVGLVEVIAKMVVYYLHERVWNRLKWGKITHPLEKLAVKKELTNEDMEKVKAQLKEMGYID